MSSHVKEEAESVTEAFVKLAGLIEKAFVIVPEYFPLPVMVTEAVPTLILLL